MLMNRYSIILFSELNTLSAKKADNKIYVCKISENAMSKLYHTIEKSKSRGQTVQIWMKWLMMSHLIRIYAICKCSYFPFWHLRC